MYYMEGALTIFKALSDETRLKIVKFLLDGKRCVCEIFPHVKRTQSTTSIQLDVLRNAGILDSRKEGKKVFYFIKDKRVLSNYKNWFFVVTAKKHIAKYRKVGKVVDPRFLKSSLDKILSEKTPHQERERILLGAIRYFFCLYFYLVHPVTYFLN